MMRRSALIVAILFALAAPAAAQSAATVVNTLVAVQADLAARNVPMNGPCGAFGIISRAAWRLRGDGVALFGGKTAAQNGCTVGAERYAIDILIVNGCVYDVLINAETENRPTFAAPLGCGATPGTTNWRPVFDPDPALPTPEPESTPAPEPTPAPLPAVDLTPLLLRLEALAPQLAAMDAKLAAIAEEQRAQRAAVNSFFRQYGLPILTALGAVLGGRVIP